MVTIYKTERADIMGAGKFLTEFRGLSDDDKPTSIDGGTIENGSTFIEIDTGDTYMYDLENTTWYKVASGNGGSEPMEKFDYVIPAGLSIYGATQDTEITNSDILDVLNSMRESDFTPIHVGFNYDDGDDNLGFSECISYQIVNNKIEEVVFYTFNGHYVYIYYSSSKWYYGVYDYTIAS